MRSLTNKTPMANTGLAKMRTPLGSLPLNAKSQKALNQTEPSRFTPLSLPNPLFYFKSGYGQVTSGVGESQRLASWNDASGRSSPLVQATAGSQPLCGPDRMHPNLIAVQSANGDNRNMSCTTPAYKMSGFSWFCFIRRAKSNSTNPPNCVMGYLCSFTGASPLLLDGVYVGASNGSPAGYKYFFVSNVPQSGLSVAGCTYDSIGFTVATDGSFLWYENGIPCLPTSTSKLTTSTVFTGWQMSYSVNQLIDYKLFEAAAYQSQLSQAQVAKLTAYWFRSLGRQAPTRTITLVGDSIMAGYPVVDTNPGNLGNLPAAEGIAQLMPEARVADLTRTSTQLADGSVYMRTDGSSMTTDFGSSAAVGGGNFHGRYSLTRQHVIEHGTNDVFFVTTPKTNDLIISQLRTCIAQQVLLGQDVFACTLIARVTASPFANQAAADAAIAAYNTALTTYGVSTWGLRAIIDNAALPPFAQGGYSNTTYYRADGIHPTPAGRQLLVVNIANTLKTSGRSADYVAPASYTFINDLFVDANSTAIASHSPGNGLSWKNSGTWSIQSNTLQNSASTGFAYTACTFADCTTTVTCTPLSTGDVTKMGIVFRFKDASNYWTAYVNYTSSTDTTVWNIDQITAGTTTNRATLTVATSGRPNGSATLSIAGAVITFTFYGQTISYGSGTRVPAASYFGLIGGGGNQVNYSNFKVQYP